MSEPIILHSVPGTGTVFVDSLLSAHRAIGVISIEGRDAVVSRSIDFLCGLFVEGELSREMLDLYINYAANLVYTNPTKLDQLKEIVSNVALFEMATSVSSSSLLYTVIESHAYPNRLNDRYWVSDMIDAGYTAKTIIPFRDPIQSVLTCLIRGTGKDHYRRITLDRNAWGFQFFIDHIDDMPTYCIPVDLPGEQRFCSRILFDEFLNIERTSEVDAFIESWTPVNDSNFEFYLDQLTSDVDRNRLRLLFEMKAALRFGESVLGMLSEVDEEIRRYNSMTSLRDLYMKCGYEDLSWF